MKKVSKPSKAEFSINGKSEIVDLPEDKSGIFICECSGEAVFVKQYAGENEVYFSYWKEGLSSTKLDWRDRLKLSWKIMVDGTPYVDMVILSKKTAKSLASFLNKIA